MLPDSFFAGTHQRAANVSEHAHPCPELILIVEGHCEVNTQNSQLHAGIGDIILMPPKVVHDQVSDGYIETIYVGFQEHDKNKWAQPTVVTLDNCRVIQPCMELLAEIYQKRMNATETSANAILYAILEQLNHHLHTLWTSPGLPARLQGLIRYIDEHFADPITTESLADKARMSASNVHALFRQHLNTSPMRYLLKRRMHAGRIALQDPYLTVKEVAHRCGYADVNYFIRVFRKEHGMSPGRWREKE